MNTTTHRTRQALLSAVVAAALITTGCHVPKPYEPTPPTAAAKALDELKSLPTFEETKAQTQDAIDAITTTASKLIPTVKWETADNADVGNCPKPYDQSDGQSAYLPNRLAEYVTVSEQDWTSILQVAKDSAAKIGATEIQVIHDQPGNHDVWFSGPTGIFIKVSYQGNLVVSGYTGCRLPAAKK